MTTAQDVSVMVLHQTLDFEIRGEDLILNEPIETVAQMNALYAPIMSCTGDVQGGSFADWCPPSGFDH